MRRNFIIKSCTFQSKRTFSLLLHTTAALIYCPLGVLSAFLMYFSSRWRVCDCVYMCVFHHTCAVFNGRHSPNPYTTQALRSDSLFTTVTAQTVSTHYKTFCFCFNISIFVLMELFVSFLKSRYMFIDEFVNWIHVWKRSLTLHEFVHKTHHYNNVTYICRYSI